MYVVCTLYHFVRLHDCRALQAPLLELLQRQRVRGTLLLAPEGINGTVAGTRDAIDTLLDFLKRDGRFSGMSYKESQSDRVPFHRTRVKLKKEIVTMGVDNVDPAGIVGTYVKPRDWNRLISDPAVTVIDTRNDYEVQIGTFKNAVNPHTASFREFPAYARANLSPNRHRKVAMFCTGGIRCEKSTAWLKSLGFDEVYHLEGGILKYLEEMPEEESLWRGECFVFDERVSVTHGLRPGHYEQCHACRMPISAADKQSPAYVPGVSCPHCIDRYSAADRRRFAERERQVRLAEARGEQHLGYGASESQHRNRTAKSSLRTRAPEITVSRNTGD